MTGFVAIRSRFKRRFYLVDYTMGESTQVHTMRCSTNTEEQVRTVFAENYPDYKILTIQEDEHVGKDYLQENFVRKDSDLETGNPS